MSQYRFNTTAGRIVLFGLDKPMGGFFFSEQYTGAELDKLPENTDPEIAHADGLTLTALHDVLGKNYGYRLSIMDVTNLILDWRIAPDPAPLQVNVDAMFQQVFAQMGIEKKPAHVLLAEVQKDLYENW